MFGVSNISDVAMEVWLLCAEYNVSLNEPDSFADLTVLLSWLIRAF